MVRVIISLDLKHAFEYLCVMLLQIIIFIFKFNSLYLSSNHYYFLFIFADLIYTKNNILT